MPRGRGGRVGRAARAVVVDVEPLRSSRPFRLLWSGQLVSFLGTQITAVAAPVQVYGITRSTFAVGLLGLVQLGPLLVCSLLGGALADALDRRRLLLLTNLALAATTVALALNAASSHPRLWPIYVASGAAAGLSGIDSPTRQASIPGLVRDEQFPAALALNQIVMTTGLALGPAVGGLLIAQLSLTAAYGVDVATFAVALVFLLRMDPMPPLGGGRKAGFRSIAEGLRFLKGRRALQGTFVIDINAMVFGMPRAVFPQLAATTFGGGAGVAGLLYAAPGTGALIGALSSGWVGRVRRQGRAVLVSVLAWGVAIAAFGFSPWLWLALVFLRWPVRLTSCPPCSATRSCSLRCPTTSGAGSRRYTSRWSLAARASATPSRARSPPSPARRPRWSPAGWRAWPGWPSSRACCPSWADGPGVGRSRVGWLMIAVPGRLSRNLARAGQRP